jgi:hypothetical protein
MEITHFWENYLKLWNENIMWMIGTWIRKETFENELLCIHSFEKQWDAWIVI